MDFDKFGYNFFRPPVRVCAAKYLSGRHQVRQAALPKNTDGVKAEHSPDGMNAQFC
ncbi:hypothetical protein MES5069_620126 [Mesorhizobium escarrei]|uniref:Uncharacterized protein n=1 Tax=Mesorhizobium escarrei TaxID=666018 RepID=A0ABM9EEV4_9HYPH|nr:hypothetical protein MES5069_620126 [Mesorhizobium escarrei]